MRSISIPFQFSNGKVVETENDDKIARQRIVDVLATDKYERVMRPDYGADIRSLLFEPLDPLIFADFRVDAIKDINDYVSNAKITDLQIREGNPIEQGDYAESTLSVRVLYRTAAMGASTFVATITGNTIITEESII
jgi:phage baseplate assembly protein W